MSRARLPPLQSADADSEANDVRPKKRPKAVPQNADDDIPITEPVRRPRRRAQKSVRTAGGADSQLDDTVTENELARQSDAVPPERKRKRKARPINPVSGGELGLAGELNDINEDVVDNFPAVETSADGSGDAAAAVNVVGVTAMRSEPTPKVFLEKSYGFKPADKNKLAETRAQAELRAAAYQPPEPLTTNTIQFALSTHNVFKVISVFLQGLFGGIALWQIVSTYMLIIPTEYDGSNAFTVYYQPTAIPYQCLYYFLCAFACVAVLDRYDLATATRSLLIRSVSFQAGTICVLFYFAGLIISLGTATLDEPIGLNQTATLPNGSSGCQWLCQWQILNIFRDVLVILGWFVISLRPTTDRLTKSIQKANDDILIRPVTVTTANNNTAPPPTVAATVITAGATRTV